MFYTYVGEVSPRSRGNDQDHSKAVHAKSQTARRHSKEGRCASRTQLQRKPYQKRLGRTPSNKIANACTNPRPLFREGGCGKVRCQLDSDTSLESKMARRKQIETRCETRSGEQLTSTLETTQRRPPPSYDAHLTGCVMIFQ